jgi:hypothetical protein
MARASLPPRSFSSKHRFTSINRFSDQVHRFSQADGWMRIFLRKGTGLCLGSVPPHQQFTFSNSERRLRAPEWTAASDLRRADGFLCVQETSGGRPDRFDREFSSANRITHPLLIPSSFLPAKSRRIGAVHILHRCASSPGRSSRPAQIPRQWCLQSGDPIPTYNRPYPTEWTAMLLNLHIRDWAPLLFSKFSLFRLSYGQNSRL